MASAGADGAEPGLSEMEHQAMTKALEAVKKTRKIDLWFNEPVPQTFAAYFEKVKTPSEGVLCFRKPTTAEPLPSPFPSRDLRSGLPDAICKILV